MNPVQKYVNMGSIVSIFDSCVQYVNVEDLDNMLYVNKKIRLAIVAYRRDDILQFCSVRTIEHMFGVSSYEKIVEFGRVPANEMVEKYIPLDCLYDDEPERDYKIRPIANKIDVSKIFYRIANGYICTNDFDLLLCSYLINSEYMLSKLHSAHSDNLVRMVIEYADDTYDMKDRTFYHEEQFSEIWYEIYKYAVKINSIELAYFTDSGAAPWFLIAFKDHVDYEKYTLLNEKKYSS